MTTKFKKGDVIKCNRGLYWHFGVYSGRKKVIHFSTTEGEETDAKNADVIETNLDTFCKGDTPVIDVRHDRLFSRDEVVRRARSKIGTEKGLYNLLTYNCEHFANWCRSGNTSSLQVDKAFGFGAKCLLIGVALATLFPSKREMQIA